MTFRISNKLCSHVMMMNISKYWVQMMN